MLKRTVLYIIVITLLASCYSFKKPKKPDNLLSKKNMVDIIMDIKLLSAATGANKIVLNDNNISPENYIYKKYNTDSLQFALSNDYYAYYIKDYESIYTKVKDSLEALKTIYKDLEEQEKREKKERDSLSLLKNNDTVKPIISFKKRDSIAEVKLKKGNVEKLIVPVSETDFQLQ